MTDDTVKHLFIGGHLFVGERRSNKAKHMRVRWSDGALAAKPLFEALRACGIDPTLCQFVNWFEGGKTIARKHKGTIVAMGNKVHHALAKEGIAHVAIVHPAARGAIRKRATYINHVRERLVVRRPPSVVHSQGEALGPRQPNGS